MCVCVLVCVACCGVLCCIALVLDFVNFCWNDVCVARKAGEVGIVRCVTFLFGFFSLGVSLLL